MSICITELSGIDNIGLGIELELPSSELELNCKNGIDPGSGPWAILNTQDMTSI